MRSMVEGASEPTPARVARHLPCRRGGTDYPRGLAKNVLGAGDEKTGAARLAPDALIACARRTVIVVAREELALVDPQFAGEEVQLFGVRMCMRRVPGAGRQAYQHADPVPFGVGRE